MGGNLINPHQPCPDCGSSDALSEYDDHTYCFSCTAYHGRETRILDNNWTYQYVPLRGITAETMKFFDAKCKVVGDEPKELDFKYGNGRTKTRILPKKFTFSGELNSDTGFLYGRDKFSLGCAKAVTVVEGELDALSVFQMLGSKYPVVSVSSSSSARSDCTRDFDFLNSFEHIYLAFDSDEPGQKAKHAVASLFDFNKVYDVKLDLKDPNEYLQSGKVKEFVSAWWAAKRFLPEGVVSSFSEIDNIIDTDEKKESVPYPFPKLNEQTYGIRTGEVILLKAQEGIGKTEIIRAIEYHLLKTTDANIGILHLEEDKGRTLKGLAGYELETPVHLPDSQVSKDDIKKALRSALKRDERVHIYTHFGSDDPDVILNTIRFMAGPCGCKYIFLDHITMVVTGLLGDDERRALDYISTRLAMMVKELDFCLFMISHVNDEGQTRGSRNIGKVAHLTVSLDRNLLSDIADVRNTTVLTVEKNRFASQTGPSSRLKFNPDTFMIAEEVMLPT
jgi:twinkle protein